MILRALAVLSAAAIVSALAVSSATASTVEPAVTSHPNTTAATDCEYIENYADDYGIAGNGVNTPVTLHTTGQCFTPMFEFSISTYNVNGQAVTANGWEYQNGDGKCLWNDNGTIETGAACETGHPNEEFYGIPGSQSKYGGWLVANVTDTPAGASITVVMGAKASSGDCGSVGNKVIMAGSGVCNLWNFPSG